jgi:thymidylate synthase
MNNNIDKQYQDLLRDILYHNNPKVDRTGTGTISVFGRQIRHKMSEGFPLLTTKKMAWKTMVTELLWFLRGDTNIKYLVDNNCHIWNGDCYANYKKKISEVDSNGNVIHLKYPEEPLTQEDFINKIKTDEKFVKQWGDLGPIYGRMWRKFDEDSYGGIDQIQNLIDNLKTNPDSRRLMVTAWHPGYNEHSVLPPCHYGFQVYTRELSLDERLEIFIKSQNLKEYEGEVQEIIDMNNTPKRAISLMFNMRSNDVPLGLPFNLASYGLLLELFGKLVNMVPDELIANLGDAHIYLNQIEGVKEQLKRDPFDLPTLRINTEFWPTKSGECGVGELTEDINFLIREMRIDDFQIENYKSHTPIKIPLSN